jgi:hypothetical protein
MRTYDHILFDESGQSFPLSADELIDYLLQNLQQLRSERDLLERQLANIRLILDPAMDVIVTEKISVLNF